jgi:putative serine protease PepD
MRPAVIAAEAPGTVVPMSSGPHDDADDADDGIGAAGPPLPPEDRLWRHPSELGEQQRAAAPGPAPAAPSSRTASGLAVVAAGIAGAVLTVGVIALTGSLSPRVVERQVVEKVAVTPVVSSPMVRGDRGVVDVADRLRPAIVRLDVEGEDGVATGSGVVFRDDGMVLTSAHVVEGASGVRVRLADGERYQGEVVGIDELTDVAVVHIDAEDLPVAVLGTAEGLEVGAPAVAIGSPLGLEGGPSVTTGVISAVDRTISGGHGVALHGMIQTDAPIAPGSSGGALVDTSGAVIGIVTALAGEPGSRFGFATPIDLAHRIAVQLVEQGRAVHGWLGVEGVDLPADDATSMDIDGGAVVQHVLPDSPAAAAGLAEGDVITHVDGEPVESMPDLVVEVREREPGDEVEVGYVRDGAPAEADATIAERP